MKKKKKKPILISDLDPTTYDRIASMIWNKLNEAQKDVLLCYFVDTPNATSMSLEFMVTFLDLYYKGDKTVWNHFLAAATRRIGMDLRILNRPGFMR